MANDRIGRSIAKSTIVDGRKTVSSAGTAEALASSSTLVSYVIITAETNNTGIVTVGASTVDETIASRRGIPLNAGDTISLGAVDLADVYLDPAQDGDGVTYLYLI